MRSLATGLALCLLVACGKGHVPTWTENVEPIVQQNCNGCHGANGIAPIGLDTYLRAKLHGAQMARQVTSGKMPPWPPSNEGVPLKGSRALKDDEIQTLNEWVASGMPEGPASAHKERTPKTAPFTADLSVQMQQPYTPQEGLSDDYRCFVIDPHASATRMVTGYDVAPGQPGNVHHVILFEVLNQGGAVEKVRAMDGADGRPGYTCFGGPMVDTSRGGIGGLPPYRLVGGWAPGQGATVLPEQTGIPLEAGAVLLMQVHYNTVNGRNADQTAARLMLADPATQANLVPALLVPIVDDRFTVPTGKVVTDSRSFVLPGFIPSFTIRAVYPHMHLLGTKISMTATHAGQTSTLIDIKNWDFHWQGEYELESKIKLAPGDSLGISCTWDNTPAHQPELNGVRGQPKDVRWGEKTTDEMCLGFLYVTF